MKAIASIIYRYLTDADFFNIYKPPGTEEGGGGQKYIDFPTSAIPVEEWDDFFSGVDGVQKNQRAKGPSWTVPVYSIGILPAVAQAVTVYQRRNASVCVAAQHIHAAHQNRVLAWRPEHGFPEPADPTNRNQLPAGLAVFFARTLDNEIWAGWFRNDAAAPVIFGSPGDAAHLRPMLDDSQPSAAGIIDIPNGSLAIDEAGRLAPFTAVNQQAAGGATGDKDVAGQRQQVRHERPAYRRHRSDEEILDSLFGEDAEQDVDDEPQVKEFTARVRRRNTRAVQDLKELYGYRCQVTGEEYSFRKMDGDYYCEAHHLAPLGTGGADDPRNIIIVSPLIHRMLHYANVSEIDLAKIEDQGDGTYTLRITINDQAYTITWRAEHAGRVLAQDEA